MELVVALLLCHWTSRLNRRQNVLDEREKRRTRTKKDVSPLKLCALGDDLERGSAETSSAARNSGGSGSAQPRLRRNATSISDGTIGSFLGDGALGSASQTVVRVEAQGAQVAQKRGARKHRKARREQSLRSSSKFWLMPIRLDTGY